VGFNKCRLTTLPEETDRLMGTVADLRWTYTRVPTTGAAYEALADLVLSTFAGTFASHQSLSLQQTMHEVALNVFAAPGTEGIDAITMSCPNVHNIPIPMDRFGVDNKNVVLMPIDEPHGDLNATFRRARSRL
jgi:urate oxidase